MPEEEIKRDQNWVATTWFTPLKDTTPKAPTTPKVEAPKVDKKGKPTTWLTPLKETKRPELDIKHDKRIRQAFELEASKGRSQSEAVSNIKEALEKKGYNSANFDTTFANTIKEFEQFDTSSDDFFTGLQTGQSYPSFVQKSANYKAGQELFSAYQSQDKSEQGIYLGVKSNSIDPAVLSKLKNDPEAQQFIVSANNRLVKEKLANWEIKSLYELPVAQQGVALKELMTDLGLNKDWGEKIEKDNIISTQGSLYLSAVGDLDKLYKKRDSLRNSIKRRYPNAAPDFISAIYNRESADVSAQINEKEAEASTSKTAYDFRLGEIKTVADLEKTQTQQKFTLFNNLQRDNYSLYLEELKQADKETVEQFQFLTPAKGVIAKVNKVSGDIEFVNYSNAWETYNAETGTTKPSTITTAWGVKIGANGADFSNSNYVSKYPNNASFKNNNPAGITWGVSDKLKGKLEAAGINIKKGSLRPADEWNNYIGFDNLTDWLSAMKISFYQTGWTDVESRLKAWKGAGTEAEKKAYADDILKATFDSTENRTFDSLSGIEKEQLLVEHLKREDWALYSVLKDEIGAIGEDWTINYSLLKAGWGNLTEWQVKETINWVEVALGTLGVPIDFERTIKSQIATSQLNSDTELAAANDTIQALHKAGYDTETAAQVFQGFRIRNKDNLWFGTNLLKYYRNIIVKPEGWLGNLAAQINTNNRAWAVWYIESVVQQEIKNLNPKMPTRSETKAELIKYNWVLDSIAKAPGVVSGTIDNFLKQLWDADKKALYLQLQKLNAAEQKELFGAQVSGGEEAMFDAIKLHNNDQVASLIAKVQTLKGLSLKEMNSYRGLRLPQLKESHVIDDKQLTLLYGLDDSGNEEEDGVYRNDINEWEKDETIKEGAWGLGRLLKEWYSLEEAQSLLWQKQAEGSDIFTDKPTKESTTLWDKALNAVTEPYKLWYKWTKSFVTNSWDSAQKTSGGFFKMADKLALSNANTIRELIGKEPITLEQAKASGIAVAWGLESTLQEDFLDVGGGSLELGLTAWFPVATLGMTTAAETEEWASVLHTIGWAVVKGWEIINKAPVLSTYRESLPEERRKDFDAYVGQLSTMWLIKAGGVGSKAIISKYKTVNTKAVTTAVRGTAKEFEYWIAQGAEKGVEVAIKNSGKKTIGDYSELWTVVQKSLGWAESTLNKSIKTIDSTIKSKGQVTFWGKHPSVRGAIEQLETVYKGAKSSEGRVTLTDVAVLRKAYESWTITVAQLQQIKRLHTSSNSIFTTKGVERWTMTAQDLSAVRRDIKGLIEENGIRQGVKDIAEINNNYSNLLNAKTIVKTRQNQLSNLRATTKELGVLQKTFWIVIETVKAPLVKLLEGKRAGRLDVAQAEAYISKISSELRAKWVSESKINSLTSHLLDGIPLTANY